MTYIKINNLFNNFGQPDYKGLDINQFIAGSQVYDMKNNFCVVATNQNVINFTDINIIDETTYNSTKTAVLANKPIDEWTQYKSVVDQLVKDSLI